MWNRADAVSEWLAGLGGARTLAVWRRGHDAYDVLCASKDTDLAAVHTAVQGIGAEWNVRLDCLALNNTELAQLLRDETGNDAKQILVRGAVLAGNRPAIHGEWAAPRPASMDTRHILYNMARFGFSMAGSPRDATEEIRLEYLVAGVMFEGDSRRIGAGIPVMLCKNPINAGLLLFLARRYRFAGRLYGMLTAVGDRVPARMMLALKGCGTKPVGADRNRIREALRVYAS